MMIALYIIGGIAVILIVLALIAPKETRIHRSISVSKARDEVYDDIRSLKTFVKWSPWSDRDPNLEFGFKGDDGRVGSVYWWKGNKAVGEGEQEVKAVSQDEKVEMELRFLRPFKATADTWFEIASSPDGNGSQLTWHYRSQNKFPFSIFLIFMNMDKALGGDFQKGLDRYKAMVES